MTAVDNERYKSWSFTYRILKMSCSGVCLDETGHNNQWRGCFDFKE